MKKTIGLTLIILNFISCNKIFKEHKNENISNETEREYLVGGEKDEHGCVASAGYTWSILKNECVRVFEIGYRLNPILETNEGDAIISAFVIFDETKNKVELFLPNTEKSIILNKVKEDDFRNDSYNFNSKTFILYKKDQKIYEGAKGELKDYLDIDDDESIISE